MAEKEKDIKVKPKPSLVRLNGSPSPGFTGKQNLSKLCSFKAPRDLTLGAAQVKTEKKKFVPNLNVTRNIKKENNSDTPKNKENKGKQKKEKNVKKEKPALIQTTGSVFAEGIGAADAAARRKLSGAKYGGGGENVGNKTSSLDTGIYNKEEEEERLKALMRDDFIDDLKSGDCVPVQLPMVDTGKIFNEIKAEKQEEIDIDIKLEPTETVRKNCMRLDSDDDSDPDDIKPPPPITSHLPADLHQSEQSVADLVKNKSEELFFIQMPDHLPGVLDDEAERKSKFIHLDHLEEGCIGKLQMRKSGACQLVLGDHVMNVQVGTKVGFLQDAVSVETCPDESSEDTRRGTMTVLGHVSQRLIVTPDWDNLMDKSGLCSTLA